jgi:putative redox protein
MAADSIVKASVKWVEGLQFVGQPEGSRVAVVLDGPEAHGGLEGGMRPIEALVVSLASCTAMDVISVLQKKRQKVADFSVHAVARRADEHPRRLETVELEFVVRGHQVSEAAVARAIELSQTKYCGVTASLNAQVSYTFRVIPAGLED